MINWMYFPKNKPLDEISSRIIDAAIDVEAEIDSFTHEFKSDDVLSIVRPGLEQIGFQVEKSKKSSDIVSVPVLYGRNGKIEKSFEADGYLAEHGYVVEIEAGRAVVNYQILKDFFEACTMVNVHHLCIAVRNQYRSSNDFEKTCVLFESLYASNRLGIPLDGLLIIGY